MQEQVKSELLNSLSRQCMSIEEMWPGQIEGLRQGLKELDREMLAPIKTVLLTGCGDSYYAAQAAAPGFRALAPMLECRVCRCIDIAREDLLQEYDPAQTLVVGISASGGPSRVAEALIRSKSKGFVAMALTNSPASRAARMASTVMQLHTPPFGEGGPGMRSYVASIFGLFALAAALSGDEKMPEKLFAAAEEYGKDFFPELSGISAQMLSLAESWKDADCAELIGDEREAGSAGFVGAKLVEAAGFLVSVIDSEDWCHVHFLANQPEKVPVVVVANRDLRNRTRIGETLHQVCGIGRPALLIADAPAAYFGETEPQAQCLIPSPPQGWEFLSVLLDCLPGSLLAAHHAAICGQPFFCGPEGPHMSSPSFTINKTSRIEVY